MSVVDHTFFLKSFPKIACLLNDDNCLHVLQLYFKSFQLNPLERDYNFELLCFSCIVNGAFKSLRFLLNQCKLKSVTKADFQIDFFSHLINKSSLISPHKRQELCSYVGLEALENSTYYDSFPISLHLSHVSKNSNMKMLSHCILDYILFDCSNYCKYICMTLEKTSSWYRYYKLCASDRWIMRSYYVNRHRWSLSLLKMEQYDDDQVIAGAMSIAANQYDKKTKKMNYDIDYDDKDTFNDITKHIECGIDIYKQLLDEYPSIQFITTFCRELPHFYAQSLLEQTYIKPLVEKQSGTTDNDTSDINASDEPVFEMYELSQDCQKMFGELFDQYAKTKIKMDNGNNEKQEITVMSIKDFTEYVYSCGAT